MLPYRPSHAARLAAYILGAACVMVAIVPAAVEAAAPMVKTQAPGYYRMMLGDVEITALNDGFFDLPVDKLLKQPAEKTDAALARSFLKPPVETSVNAFLVNTGAKLVLIDTGTGGLSAASAGVLLANLQAAGYKPEQVDDILITHMHGDHVGGLSHNGIAVFPNAIVHAGKADADHWLDPASMASAPDSAKGNFRTAMASLGPYIAAHRFQPIAADGEVVPGIRSIATPGHTPGHTSYVVESQGQTLIVMGDLIHVAAVQFDDPGVTIAFDSDPGKAALSRDRIFKMAAKDGALVAAAHLQFPGMGHLKANGTGWQFVPVNYTRIR